MTNTGKRKRERKGERKRSRRSRGRIVGVCDTPSVLPIPVTLSYRLFKGGTVAYLRQQ